jgi:hypothetical protein
MRMTGIFLRPIDAHLTMSGRIFEWSVSLATFLELHRAETRRE